jgi:hypothetical protein
MPISPYTFITSSYTAVTATLSKGSSMPAPGFGYSAGDFIATTGLIITVISEFKESGGVSTEYQQVVQELASYRPIDGRWCLFWVGDCGEEDTMGGCYGERHSEASRSCGIEREQHTPVVEYKPSVGDPTSKMRKTIVFKTEP